MIAVLLVSGLVGQYVLAEAGGRWTIWPMGLAVVIVLIVLTMILGGLRRSLRRARTLSEEARLANEELSREIRERHEIEQELRLNEAKNRAILDSAVDAIVVTDEQGHIVQFNRAACETFGYQPEEIVGRDVGILMAAELSQQHSTFMQRYMSSKQSKVIGAKREERARRRDGSAFPIELAVSEVNVAGRRLFTGMLRDITERKRAEAEIAAARDAALESVRLKSEFLANMSHEIRTPMNGVLGMTSLLLDTELDKEQYRIAATIRESGNALLNIINDILDFSKIDAGKMTLEEEAFDPCAAMDGVLELLAERAQSKGVELLGYVDSKTPLTVLGDSGRFRQVLTNLIGNAVKFTDQGGIMVWMQRRSLENDRVRLYVSVIDSGIGISSEGQKRLFQSFAQVDGSATRKYSGTGLGLVICAKLVELMGGTIGVKSELGKGSTFWFEINLGMPQRADRPVAEQLDVLTGRRALVLAGYPALGKTLGHYLERWGMQVELVRQASNVVPACTAAKEARQPVDLLFLDLGTVPGGANGLFDLYGVAAFYLVRPQYLVLLRNLQCKIPANVAHDLGVNAQVTKPIKRDVLRDLLIRLFSAEGSWVEQREQAPKSAAVVEEHSTRILVVEDNPINQRVALGHLSRLGFEADAVNNGQEALDRLAEVSYGLILMDVQMPVMDGLTTTREIRRRERDRGTHVPIIAMTANAMKGDAEKCYAAGMDDYIAKPFKRETLAELIEKWREQTSVVEISAELRQELVRLAESR